MNFEHHAGVGPRVARFDRRDGGELTADARLAACAGAAPRPAPPAASRRPRLALVALALYAAHAAHHLLHHHPEDLLWSCHLATVLVGLGFLAGSATAIGIGFLWLVMGDTLWVVYLAGGGEFLPTSLLTHVGGLLMSLYGMRLYGLPRHVWWQALGAFLLLQQACRWLTPAAANVNVAFAVWSGWEPTFPSYAWYMALFVAVAATVFLSVQQATRRLLVRTER